MKPLATIGNARLYRVRRNDLPSNTYIVSSPYSEKIHFNPTITDFDLSRLTVKSNEAFLLAAKRLGVFNGAAVKNFCELILLTGGFYYHLNRAFYNVFRHSLPAGFLGVRRTFGKTPLARVSYENLEAVPSNNITLVGDTIATGATLQSSLPYYLQRAPRVKKLLIFSIAGALPGAQELAKLEKTIRKKYGTRLFVFFADAIFGLAENQTDMFYLHKDTIAPEISLQRARRRLGVRLGKEMCVIWDWGRRNKDPMGHLREVIAAGKKWGRPAEAIVKKAQEKLRERENS